MDGLWIYQQQRLYLTENSMLCYGPLVSELGGQSAWCPQPRHWGACATRPKTHGGAAAIFAPPRAFEDRYKINCKNKHDVTENYHNELQRRGSKRARRDEEGRRTRGGKEGRGEIGGAGPGEIAHDHF